MNRGAYSAYHGGTWKARARTHHQEVASERWPAAGLNSEFKRMKEVLLYAPPRAPQKIVHPEHVQHLRKIDWRRLRHELIRLEKIYQRNGVRVRRMDAGGFTNPKPNLMFTRDHFFITPWGAILGRMASEVRAGEEKWAQKSLADSGIPILAMIRGRGTFEGADALWISPKTVLIGTGNRTNRAGFIQLKKILREFNVNAISVQLPKSVQHLLGILQIVDRRLALVRTEKAGEALLKILRRHRYRVISVAESKEVRDRQGMNIVTLSPRSIIMPSGCPKLKILYLKSGLRILAEAPFSQGLNAAGGIACATAILSRSLR